MNSSIFRHHSQRIRTQDRKRKKKKTKRKRVGHCGDDISTPEAARRRGASVKAATSFTTHQGPIYRHGHHDNRAHDDISRPQINTRSYSSYHTCFSVILWIFTIKRHLMDSVLCFHTLCEVTTPRSYQNPLN